MRGLITLVGYSISLAAGCTPAYLQETRAQERAAADLAPANVESGRAAPRPTQDVPVRVWATPRYRSEVQDWRTHVDALLARASETTGPALGLHLVPVALEEWDAPEASSLDGTLAALAARDPGDDVGLVLGLVESTAILAPTLETLGFGHVLGKHLVVRAASDAAESDAFEEAFDRLDRDERRRLRHDRKAHRELVVLLHEIGHVLGALHVRETWGLMHAAYAPEMTRVTPANLALMTPVVAMRFGHDDPEQRLPSFEDTAKAMLTTLGEHEDGWLPEERAWMIAALEDSVKAIAEHRADPFAGTLWTMGALPKRSRTTLGEAHMHYQARRVQEAWDTLAPLVASHPDVYAVQELACAIGIRGAGGSDAHAACERMMALSLRDPAPSSSDADATSTAGAAATAGPDATATTDPADAKDAASAGSSSSTTPPRP